MKWKYESKVEESHVCYVLSHFNCGNSSKELVASRVWLFLTAWMVAHGLSMGFSKYVYCGGLSFAFSRGIFLTQGIEPGSPALQANSLQRKKTKDPIRNFKKKRKEAAITVITLVLSAARSQ